MADKIVVMKDGRVEQIGSPLDLYDGPVNQFVAGFIGSPAMNFLPGTYHAGDTGPRIDLGEGLHWPAPPSATAALGQQVLYGIRPEHLQIADAQTGIPAEVVVVEPTGADTQVFAKVGATEIACVFRDRFTVRTGDTLYLKPELQRAHLFDAASGLRLVKP